MAMQWFRMYAEFASDPKVQSMDETLQRRFVMLLCLQCSGDLVKLDETELAFHLRVSLEEMKRTLEVFRQKGFVGDTNEILNWNKRQYKSDFSTPRVKRFREKKKRRETVSVTPSESDTDSDSDTDSKKIKNPSASATPKKVVDPDWFLDFRAAYPPRAGDQGWRKALRAANARVAEGHSTADFIAGARRYAVFCEASGKLNTEFVKQACTFLGPDKPFLLPWHPPKRAESATDELLRRLDQRDNSRVIEHESGFKQLPRQ